MIRTATEATSSHDSSRLYQCVIFLSTKKRRHAPRRRFVSPGLLDAVDLGEDLLGADFLRVRRHHRVDQLLHLVAPLERNALELALLLHLGELLLVFRGLDLPPV